jgi:hypothetical protein
VRPRRGRPAYQMRARGLVFLTLSPPRRIQPPGSLRQPAASSALQCERLESGAWVRIQHRVVTRFQHFPWLPHALAHWRDFNTDFHFQNKTARPSVPLALTLTFITIYYYRTAYRFASLPLSPTLSLSLSFHSIFSLYYHFKFCYFI